MGYFLYGWEVCEVAVTTVVSDLNDLLSFNGTETMAGPATRLAERGEQRPVSVSCRAYINYKDKNLENDTNFVLAGDWLFANWMRLYCKSLLNGDRDALRLHFEHVCEGSSGVIVHDARKSAASKDAIGIRAVSIDALEREPSWSANRNVYAGAWCIILAR